MLTFENIIKKIIVYQYVMYAILKKKIKNTKN